VSYQVLQWLPYEAIVADCKATIDERAGKLAKASESPKAAGEYLLQPEDEDSEEEQELKYVLLEVMRADIHHQLDGHPWVVNGLARLLRQKWLHLATGGGLKAVSLMMLPDETLPDGSVSSPNLTEGPVIAFRYPVRSWWDVKVLRVTFNRECPPGAVLMNTATAQSMAGDFDGDYCCFMNSSEYPDITEAIGKMHNERKPPEIPRPSEKRSSPIEKRIPVLLDAMQSRLAWAVTLCTKANAQRQLATCDKLAGEVQKAVDGLKWWTDVDVKFLKSLQDELPELDWLEGLNEDKSTFLKYPLAATGSDTISRLVQYTSRFWKAPNLLAKPLHEFSNFFPEGPEELWEEAKACCQVYARQVVASIEEDDPEILTAAIKELKVWAANHPDPYGMACALWHESHRYRKPVVVDGKEQPRVSTGSITFHAFPEQIVERLSSAPEPPVMFTVVGLPYNEWAAEVSMLNAQTEVVTIQAVDFNGQQRLGCWVQGKQLGLVSKETPTPAGVYLRKLAYNGRGAVYVTAP